MSPIGSNSFHVVIAASQCVMLSSRDDGDHANFRGVTGSREACHLVWSVLQWKKPSFGCDKVNGTLQALGSMMWSSPHATW